MSKKPTQKEIEEEIVHLEEAKKFAPRLSMFSEDNHAQIDRQIEYLRGDIDTTADEFNDLPDNEQSAVMEAETWKEGQSIDGAPSQGWEMYRSKKKK